MEVENFAWTDLQRSYMDGDGSESLSQGLEAKSIHICKLVGI
jgi:hypothetical protein